MDHLILEVGKHIWTLVLTNKSIEQWILIGLQMDPGAVGLNTNY